MDQKPGIRKTALADLTLHPDNPRQGDIGAIMQSIEQNGFVGVLVAQCSTGHVITGNHRMQAAANLGFTELKVEWKDCSDEEALRLLLADNRTSDLATNDDAVMAELLISLATTDIGLPGTGYDGDDLDTLIQDLDLDSDSQMPEGKGAALSIVDVSIGDPSVEPETDSVWRLGNHRLFVSDVIEGSPVWIEKDGEDPLRRLMIERAYLSSRLHTSPVISSTSGTRSTSTILRRRSKALLDETTQDCWRLGTGRRPDVFLRRLDLSRKHIFTRSASPCAARCQ